MDSSKWLRRFRRRVKSTLRQFKKKEVNDFDEPQQQYKLVSLLLINLGGKKRKGVKAPPVHGNALYYVVSQDGEEVTLLHPHLLKLHKVSRRVFEKGITDVWWPNEEAKRNPEAKNKYGMFCNRFKVADSMLKRLEMKAKEEGALDKKLQKTIRIAISDLGEISLERVPKFKIAKKVDGLKTWREQMAKSSYKQRAGKDLKKFAKKKDQEAKKVSKKSKKKESKSKKKAKPDKGGKPDPKAKKSGVKLPKSKKASKAVVIRYLFGHKGKTVSVEKLAAEVQKARGMKKEYPEKKILSKVKAIGNWAKKAGLEFKSSSKGMKLSA